MVTKRIGPMRVFSLALVILLAGATQTLAKPNPPIPKAEILKLVGDYEGTTLSKLGLPLRSAKVNSCMPSWK